MKSSLEIVVFGQKKWQFKKKILMKNFAKFKDFMNTI